VTRAENCNAWLAGECINYGVDAPSTWAAQVASDTNLISTNKINEHTEPFSKTHNDLGYPFSCVASLPHCGTAYLVEDTRTVELLVRSADIDGTKDNFVFLHNDYTDTGYGTSRWSAFVSVASSEIGEEWSKGCLMARQSLAPGSPYFAVCRAADDKELFVQVRREGCTGPCPTRHTDANLENSMADPPSESFLYEEAAFIKLEITKDARGAHPRAFVSLDGHPGHWTPLLADGHDDWYFRHGLPLQGLAASSNTVKNTNADGSPIRFVFGNIKRNSDALTRKSLRRFSWVGDVVVGYALP
jgi:hypothetical protein